MVLRRTSILATALALAMGLSACSDDKPPANRSNSVNTDLVALKRMIKLPAEIRSCAWQTGNRLVVVQLDIEVHDQRPRVNAQAIASRARTRIQWPSSLAALAALDLAMVGIEQVQVTDYELEDRFVSRRTMDVRLNASSRETDSAGAVPYIATVTTTATITHPDGSAVDPDIAPGGILP